jgi:hypothetical protein
MKTKNVLQITVAFLGIYAGLVGIQHGIFEILQGNLVPSGIMIQAIGAPCRTETAWHACFPAMTLIPNLLVTGIAATIAGMSVLVWSVMFVQRKHGGIAMMLLSILMLLTGGGFVPAFTGIVAGIAGTRIHAPVKKAAPPLLVKLWLWTLILMAVWVPGSWLLGYFFNSAMLASSGLPFLFFDIILPVLAAVLGVASNHS